MPAFRVKAIGSYLTLHTPKLNEQSGKMKYSATLLIHKSDTASIKAVNDAIEAAKKEGAQKGMKNLTKTTFYDGAEKYPDDPKYHDYMILNTSAVNKPTVVRMDASPVTDPQEVYSGMICWFGVNAYPYNSNGNKGIAVGLNHVLTTGEEGALGRLDGRAAIESVFGDLLQPAAEKPEVNAEVETPEGELDFSL